MYPDLYITVYIYIYIYLHPVSLSPFLFHRADFIKQLIKEGRERHFGAGPLASNNVCTLISYATFIKEKFKVQNWSSCFCSL